MNEPKNSKRFRIERTVETADIDEFNIMFNEFYLKWANEVAAIHAESKGFGLEDYLRRGAGFVVRKHELEYFKPALLGDELILETWVPETGRCSVLRETNFIRKKDGRELFRARTLWVYIDLKTALPIELAPDIRAALDREIHENSIA